MDSVEIVAPAVVVAAAAAVASIAFSRSAMLVCHF